MNIIKPTILLNVFTVIYLITISFIGFIDLPIVGKKLQLAEITWLFFTPLIFYYLWKRKSDFKVSINLIDKAILFYLLMTGIATFVNPALILKSGLQWAGMVYLGSVSFFFKLWVNHQTDDKWMFDLARISRKISLALGVLSIIGWGLWYFQGFDGFVQAREGYLYFSQIARTKLFALDPNMFADQLLIFLFLGFGFQYFSAHLKNIDYLLVGIIVLGLSLSLSKSCLLLCLFLPKTGRFGRFFSKICILILLYVTHFFTIQTQDFDVKKLNTGGSYVADYPLLSIGNYTIYPTSYSFTKYASVRAFLQSPITGIGLERQSSLACELQSKNQYPAYFGCHDTHCVYTGMLGETGIIGFVGLSVFIFLMLKALQQSFDWVKNNSHAQRYVPLLTTISIILAFMAVQSSFLETYTFRQYWIVIGIFSGLFDKIKFTNTPLSISNN